MRREQDPGECRTLRQIEREIGRQMDQIRREIQTLRSRERTFRADIAVTASQLQKMRAAEAALGAGSMLTGPAGSAFGSGSVGASLQAAMLQQRLDEQNQALQSTLRALHQLQDDQTCLNQALRDNAARLRRLDCVTNS
ncbi:hypothetical protein [Hoeflea ulvae]|uniref:Uncharacterized protein n=1 Tax=Hoeflea ulvae TaxID=2983764 RepID=A0ABT3YK09_9HYPH|nr:hypothetical protein [Hoeflea ulvae]MCY0096233.1 hypothetical protein [Hoeflea ulvae]